MKWLGTALVAAGGCLAAAPLKLSISPMLPYPLVSVPANFWVLRVRNLADHHVNVTVSFNHTFGLPVWRNGEMSVEGDSNTTGATTNSLPLRRVPLEKSELRTKASQEIARLYEASEEDGDGKVIVLPYSWSRLDEFSVPADKVRDCLESHSEECDFAEWEKGSECRPELHIFPVLRSIVLDYTEKFDLCQPHDIQADVEFVASQFELTNVRAHHTKYESVWPLLERVLKQAPPAIPKYWSNDPLLGQQWHLHTAGVSVAARWNAFTESRFQPRVGFIGSGTDLIHNDIVDWALPSRDPPVGNYEVNIAEWFGSPGVDDDRNGFVDDIWGWTANMTGQPPYGVNGVGAEMSGIVGALHNNGIGGTGIAGENVKMIHCQRYDDNSNQTSDAFDRECFEYLDAMKADIVVYDHAVSSTRPLELSKDLKTVFDHWLKKGKPIFLPSGNSGKEITCSGTSYLYPACWNYPNHFTISSVDKNWDRSNNADYGAKAITTGAPGTDILTTAHRYFENAIDKYVSKSNHRYGAAWMAGVTALLLTFHPHLNSYDLNNLMKHNVELFPSLANTKYGGRINPERIIKYLDYEHFQIPISQHWYHYTRVPRELGPGQATLYHFIGTALPGETTVIDGDYIVHVVDQDDSIRTDPTNRATAHFTLDYDLRTTFKQIEGDLSSCEASEAFEIDFEEFLQN